MHVGGTSPPPHLQLVNITWWPSFVKASAPLHYSHASLQRHAGHAEFMCFNRSTDLFASELPVYRKLLAATPPLKILVYR